MNSDLLPTVLAFFITLVLTPIVLVLAKRLNILDVPDIRKIHSVSVPRAGGISMVIAWLVAALMILRGEGAGLETMRILTGVIAGSAAIAAFGLTDDLLGLSPIQKLGLEIAATGIFLLVAGPALFQTFPALILAALWIIFVTNAFNLIDGLDGLAAGLAALTAAGFAILGWRADNQVLLALSLALAGVCLGFLPYNRYPARLFMGDVGSLFLGFILAVLALISFPDRSGFVNQWSAPVLFLLVPLFDAALSIARRAAKGAPLFAPDKAHFYNLLMDRGFSHQGSVLFCYGLTGSYVLSGLLLGRADNVFLAPAILGAVALTLLLLIFKFRLFEV